MNLKILFTSLALILVLAAYGQTSKLLHTSINQAKLNSHLEKVKKLDADTNYIYSAIPRDPLDNLDKSNAPMHFPYPIIFIHGLAGSADAWAEFYTYALTQGWSYGGTLLFNLNSDENFSYSNIYSSTQSDIIDFNSNIPAADFYLVNFNCEIDGTSYGEDYNTTTQSNQAAIVKQGFAIGRAVQHVLAGTGKDKVILFGHSMGGLAARTYLQNPENWPSDGQHHVAKLITSGTPHGGSNLTGLGFSEIFTDIDEGSDAVRDLRRSYFYSGDPGVFLYGGRESSAVMNDRILGFQDYDVNCNGIEGDEIVGLNQKNISSDLDFACIIGDDSSDILGGDHVVGLKEAQLKTYYNLLSETFTIGAWHLRLAEQTKINYEAFDEPDFYDLSYAVETNTYYHGFISKQAPDAIYKDIDFDDFVFTTDEPGWVRVSVDNIASSAFGISVLGHPDYDYTFDEVFQSDLILTDPIYLPAGTHYLEFYAIGDDSTWEYPYVFRLDWTANNPTSVNNFLKNVEINISPNPVAETAYLKVTFEKSRKGNIQLHNALGQRVYEKQFDGQQIDEYIEMEKLENGFYFLTVSTPEGLLTRKIVKE